MSFGWSAGDIAAALRLVYNLYEALDSCDGAAKEYCETVFFLEDLTRTLEPLKTFTAWGAYPTYEKEIREQVEFIRGPVDEFLQAILKYEPSLGPRAKAGHHRHIRRKLQWYIFMSKKTLALRNKIESHMRVLDSLMQRLTLHVVVTTQQTLPDVFRAVFQETIRPDLVTVLSSTVSREGSPQTCTADKWPQLYENLVCHMVELTRSIDGSKATQQRLEACLRAEAPLGNQARRIESPEPVKQSHISELTAPIAQISAPYAVAASEQMVQESLKEV
ncbi:hypothetical protein DL771_011606 [Monosporascus sp. 5C6A]|nr:hypothetical protein DL771_011606 [Monosporascus sp. 5C6A]